MKSFDPDEEFPYVEAPTEVGRDIVDDITPIDAEATIGLLHTITSDLPGGGEDRTGQQEMASAVAVSISRGRNLVVEAGTGVGKSLAYLAPLAMSDRRVVIATATKNLQDQLARKDAPQVAAKAPGFSYTLLKGKYNYYCHLRGDEIGPATGQGSFDDDVELPQGVVAQIRRILDWAQETESGDRDSLPFEVEERAWRQVAATPPQCVTKARCRFADDCFHEKAKDKAAASDVVIVNHALYAAHLATGGNLLPDHKVVVFDEAHEVHDSLASLLGTSLSPTNIRGAAGVVRSGSAALGKERAKELSDGADRLGDALALQFASGQVEGLNESVTLELSQLVTTFTALVEALKPASNDPNDVNRIRAHQTVGSLLNDLGRIQSANDDQLVWISEDRGEHSIHLSLLEVGDVLRDNLWPQVTAVCTSATIPDGIVHQLGLSTENTDVLTVPSPFNYAENSLLYVARHLPDRQNDEAYLPLMLDELTALMTAAGGRTLSLFTNRLQMEKVATLMAERVSTPILVQGKMSKQRLTEMFRDDESASLFALDSFWQGFDIPGRSLSLVTIDRLPFRPPTDPVDKARRERLGDAGFTKIDVPRAAMMLAQGVGRLIRSTEDCGVVAVFDNRLATKSYRHLILKKMPPMKRTIDRAEVEGFLRRIVA